MMPPAYPRAPVLFGPRMAHPGHHFGGDRGESGVTGVSCVVGLARWGAGVLGRFGVKHHPHSPLTHPVTHPIKSMKYNRITHMVSGVSVFRIRYVREKIVKNADIQKVSELPHPAHPLTPGRGWRGIW